MVRTPPGSLPEGAVTPKGRDLSARRRYASEQPPQAALSESQRECPPMVPPGQRFTHSFLLTLKFLSVYVHRSALPHNANHPPAGCFVSGRVIFASFVWGCVLPFNRVLAKPWGWRAIFIAPTQLKIFWLIPFIEVHSLSFAALSSSLREGAGIGVYHSTGYSLKSQVAGDFHRPYGTLNV